MTAISPPDATEAVRLVCPRCGSDGIDSFEPVDTRYRGVRFFRIPGEPESVTVDYDHADTQPGDGLYVNDLRCPHCDAELGEQDLIEQGTAPDPGWIAPPKAPTVPAADVGQMVADSRALQRIYRILNIPEWPGAEMLEWIAEVIEQDAGRKFTQ